VKGRRPVIIGLVLAACSGRPGPPIGALADLARAAGEGNASLVRQLVARDPGLARASFEGSPSGPVGNAAKGGHAETLRILLEAGADPRERDDRGRTPLHVAETAEIAGLLLDHGVPPDVRSSEGETPLMTRTGTPSVVLRLLKAGAQPNLRDGDGRTALQHATSSVGMEHLESIAALCAYGADPLVRNEKGETAGALAQKSVSDKLGLQEQNAVMADLLAPGGVCVSLAARPATARATADERTALLLEARCRADSDGWACGRLGWVYEHGLGVAIDLPRAATLYEQSCDHGHGWGCYALAYALGHGAGVPQDEARATQLFRRGCDLGYTESCGQLAHQIQRGVGVARDEGAALPLFEKACKAADAWSCWQLGEAYAEGRGAERNPARAAELRRGACAAGEKRACSPP
jgi:TPR repeat protein